MFSLENQQAKIASFNPRAEKHGEENVPSGDLKLEVTCANAMLDHFDKGLRKMLYRKPASGEQTDLPLSDTDGLTQRKFPHLSPLKWDEDFPGYTLSIDSGRPVPQVRLWVGPSSARHEGCQAVASRLA